MKPPSARKLWLLFVPLAGYFGVSFMMLGLCFHLLLTPQVVANFKQQFDYSKIFANTSKVLGIASQEMLERDARPLIIDEYLTSIGAPMAGTGNFMVAEADRLGLDWTWIPAICMVESNCGKSIPPDSFNPFGYGVLDDGQVLMRFASWEESITAEAIYLKKEYFDKGYTNEKEVMSKYCPVSIGKGGAWAKAVEFFRNLYQNY